MMHYVDISMRIAALAIGVATILGFAGWAFHWIVSATLWHLRMYRGMVWHLLGRGCTIEKHYRDCEIVDGHGRGRPGAKCTCIDYDDD